MFRKIGERRGEAFAGFVLGCLTLTVGRLDEAGRLFGHARQLAGRDMPGCELRLVHCGLGAYGDQLFGSTDGGRHWHELSIGPTVSGRIAARPGTLRLAAALSRSGRASEIVIEPAGRPAAMSLPSAAYQFSFAGELNGWAAAVRRICPASKHGTCRATWTLLVTSNGGQSWIAVSARPVT